MTSDSTLARFARRRGEGGSVGLESLGHVQWYIPWENSVTMSCELSTHPWVPISDL